MLDLDTIEARATASSEGLEASGPAGWPMAEDAFFVNGLEQGYDHEMSRENAVFIANARADVLALVARVREIEDQRKVGGRVAITIEGAVCRGVIVEQPSSGFWRVWWSEHPRDAGRVSTLLDADLGADPLSR